MSAYLQFYTHLNSRSWSKTMRQHRFSQRSIHLKTLRVLPEHWSFNTYRLPCRYRRGVGFLDNPREPLQSDDIKAHSNETQKTHSTIFEMKYRYKERTKIPRNFNSSRLWKLNNNIISPYLYKPTMTDRSYIPAVSPRCSIM